MTITKPSPLSALDSSYSHGFESIYAFENIDPKTIRVMKPTAPIATDTTPLKIEEALPEQLLFTFMKRSISPFFLKESLEVLKLSTHAERFLRRVVMNLSPISFPSILMT